MIQIHLQLSKKFLFKYFHFIKKQQFEYEDRLIFSEQIEILGENFYAKMRNVMLNDAKYH